MMAALLLLVALLLLCVSTSITLWCAVVCMIRDDGVVVEDPIGRMPDVITKAGAFNSKRSQREHSLSNDHNDSTLHCFLLVFS